MRPLCLPGISLRIEECTQYGTSLGSSETLGEYGHKTGSSLPHLLVISVLVPVPFQFPFPFPHFLVFQLCVVLWVAASLLQLSVVGIVS